MLTVGDVRRPEQRVVLEQARALDRRPRGLVVGLGSERVAHQQPWQDRDVASGQEVRHADAGLVEGIAHPAPAVDDQLEVVGPLRDAGGVLGVAVRPAEVPARVVHEILHPPFHVRRGVELFMPPAASKAAARPVAHAVVDAALEPERVDVLAQRLHPVGESLSVREEAACRVATAGPAVGDHYSAPAFGR